MGNFSNLASIVEEERLEAVVGVEKKLDGAVEARDGVLEVLHLLFQRCVLFRQHVEVRRWPRPRLNPLHPPA